MHVESKLCGAAVPYQRRRRARTVVLVGCLSCVRQTFGAEADRRKAEPCGKSDAKALRQ